MNLMDTFEQHRADLVGFAKSLHAADPEDVVQEAALYALEKGYDKTYKPRDGMNPLSYARGLVYWKTRAQQSAEWREQSLRGKVSDDETSYTLDRFELAVDVQAALSQLPLAERVLAEGVLIHGESLQKMANVFGRSKTWAYETLELAKSKLAKELKNYAPAADGLSSANK